MVTAGKVSVPALRILTYTILIKAVVSAVRLFCTMAEDISLFSSAFDMPATGSIFVAAQTADYINAVACIMCIEGIIALSNKFVSAQRLLVAELLTDCFMLLPVTAQLYLMSAGNTTAVLVLNVIMLTLSAAESLLKGAAFLLLMQGFGESLRNTGDSMSAAAAGKIGSVYMWFCLAGAVMTLLMGSNPSTPVMAAETVLSLAGVILELLMFIRVRSAAFLIWRKRAFSDLS